VMRDHYLLHVGIVCFRCVRRPLNTSFSSGIDSVVPVARPSFFLTFQIASSLAVAHTSAASSSKAVTICCSSDVRGVKYSTKKIPHRDELALEAHLADYAVSGPWKELHYEFVQVDRTTGRSVLNVLTPQLSIS